MLQSTCTSCIHTYLIILLFYISTAYTQEFNTSRDIAYIIASKADFLNLTTCRKELQDFRKAVDQRILWSLKVLDSSGGLKPGFLYGNNYWLGSRLQCLDTINTSPIHIPERKLLNNTLYRDPQKEFPPFQVNYFIAHFKHNSTLQYHIEAYTEDVITLGLCLPASCTMDNLYFILEIIFHNRTISIDNLYSMDFQLIQVKDLRNNTEWLSSGALIFTCIVLGFSFLMTIIGTIYDVLVHQKSLKKKEMNLSNGSIETKQEKTRKLDAHENKLKNVLICFSAYTNTKNMFNTKLGRDEIPVIHGLKFINMFFVILFHIIYYTFDFLDNKIWMLRFLHYHVSYYNDFLLILVDIYFFSSGCLVTYLHLKSNKTLKLVGSKTKLTEFFISVIKRLIRLTPAYMVALGILQLSSVWLDKTSQFYIHERTYEICSKYWWRNLLYINNFFGLHNMCMSWSWYVASDMQFYTITMALLILSSTYFYTAVTILGGLLIGSSIVSGYISYIYEFAPSFADIYRLEDILYISPWVRINPYIIGIITGYILTKLNHELILKRKIIILCWCLAGACNIFIFFVFYEQHIPVLAVAIYAALHRIFWTLSIAWIVIACCTKHGGIVNRFLSFKGWIPFSRLTYCTYLLNPIVIRSAFLYTESSSHFEYISLTIIWAYIGFVIMSYLGSYVLSLTVEIPYISIMRMFTYCCDKMHTK